MRVASVLLLLLFTLPSLSFAQLENITKTQLGIPDVSRAINRNCIAYTILGPCPITPLQATHLLVSWYEPAIMVETTPRTGESIFGGQFFGAVNNFFEGVLNAATGELGTVSSGGGFAVHNTEERVNLHFHEARVYTIPGIVKTACPEHGESPVDFTMNYASDSDPLWRFGQPNASPIEMVDALSLFSGVWGRTWPRVGFLHHLSKNVAGAQAAVRAAWIAFDPVGAAGLVYDQRMVYTPSFVPPVCWGLGYPVAEQRVHNQCFPPGVHPAYWDRGLISLDSAMLHIFYEPNVTCVTTSSAGCGVAVGAGHIDNFCNVGRLLPGGIVPGLPRPAG